MKFEPKSDEISCSIAFPSELILSAAGEGIYGLDLKGHTTFCNPAAAGMIGWQLEELIGKSQHNILHHKKADGTPYPREECPIYAAFKDGKTHRVTNEVFWRKDGSSFPVEYKSTPMWDNGKLIGAVVVFRDISERVEAENALRKAFAQIEQLKDQLQAENQFLREEITRSQAFGDIIGNSSALRNISKQIELVAPTDASALILGESGTGKELVAREIHKRSLRKDQPMIKVNCASIPKDLYESEFFGHVKGAFTGAFQDRVGRFEAANGGTLFLDEVGEIPLDLQSKLLRVLQENQYERVGEVKTRHVDVRIISATNKDLKEEIAAGRFRQDLYYRLNVFPLEVVPLRSRKEDIPLLATHFVKLFAKKMNCQGAHLTQGNIVDLQRYDWPGNIRELQNVIERAIITAQCGKLQFNLLPALEESADKDSLSTTAGGDKKQSILSEQEMNQYIRENIVAALKQCDWKIYGSGGAAELLGMKATTLFSRIQKMGLNKKIQTNGD